MKTYPAYLIPLLMILTACHPEKKTTDTFTLENKSGVSASFTPYGARLMSLQVPDKNGRMTPVVWGFDSTAQYERCKDPYYGAIIGRYGNRIAGGKFTLDGKTYILDINNGPNSLHGGNKGFHTKTWDAAKPDDHTLVFTCKSKDGEGGFPGNLEVKVTYTLTDDNALRISYEASADKTTVINLTNHAYWNLNGIGSGPITGHLLSVHADRFTPVDSTLIPLGNLALVGGTPFYFRKASSIGNRISGTDIQLRNGKGYDHNFVLNPHEKQQPVAEVTGDKSAIRMQVFTDQPGLQFYSGNFMQANNKMAGGALDEYRGGFCLETQHFPDSPNQPAFPATLLKPGENYRSTTVYRFTIAK